MSKFCIANRDWICPYKKCGNVNFSKRKSCKFCGRERTTDAIRVKFGKTKIGDTLLKAGSQIFYNDWWCKRCGNENFARRSSCNSCGRERTDDAKTAITGGTEIGKTAAEESGGYFAAKDWQCKTCEHVNWARRSECNVCNTPKYTMLEEGPTDVPYSPVRPVVRHLRYIVCEESVGEYDEFGNKKEKAGGNLEASNLRGDEKAKEVSREEEEGDKDDVEDADLSKNILDNDDGGFSIYDLVTEEDDGES